MEITKKAIMTAVRAAISASLAAKGKEVPVDHPIFSGFALSARKGRAYKIQQYPSTFISLRHLATNRTAWSTTAGYLNACVSYVVENGCLAVY